ncbi:helix-turn-helix domain-containing protein [Stenotrophomonas sp. 24(2023)]|uniref:winged helix-turn-helix transcriptional regulator n=1 Tax=Stenotrophomonas sp. 24(2023) TaxID=3068324 RepID=UPI0027E12A53|nr:helix-turn-helix domain-containing protein [Stenotrophomonas sp. 24(2023)]WMJ68952.1 helix-turn-helix domain-containing protein [Stenotrophomonas sp. 24(2023)]
MIPQAPPTLEELLQQSQAACDALSEDDDGLKREILTHAGNRWSLAVVHALGVHGTLRHAQIARQLDGVTQRMLTRTLRQLERDGLIARHDHDEVPPRVDYQLTALGRGLLAGMVPLWRWVIDNAAGFRDARAQFDRSAP